MLPIALVALSFAAPAWEEAGETDGVTVWTREVAGSNVREVRAETDVPTSVDRVWDIIGDVQHYTEFMPYVLDTKVFGETADSHYEYQRIDPPFVDIRDYCVKVTLMRDDQTKVYQRKWTEANDKAPPKKDDVVRVEINKGSWTLEPVGTNKTHITYYLYTDPGGNIPAWMANKANKTSLPDLLNAVKNRSVNPKWKRD
jgi:ribosome-associated toxin RatA of RatAB toxin-antitoxin module